MRTCLAILLYALLITPVVADTDTPVLTSDDHNLSIPSELNSGEQLLDLRRQQEKMHSSRPLTLIPHKPNYLLTGYYFRKPQTAPFESQFPGYDIAINPLELKFQLSLKTLLISDLIGKTGDLWVGYTNRSFWQAFNTGRSAPFRETNHEPEIWFDFARNDRLGPFQFKGVNLGMVHQSNGQWGEVSRSWNRLYSLFILQKDQLYFALKPWWRIPESPGDDDNHDIDKYMGQFELHGLYEWQGKTLGFMLRNNLRLNRDNQGAVQIDYTLPLYNQLRGYVQLSSGYGESLIDYDHEVNTLSIGLMLSNWL